MNAPVKITDAELFAEIEKLRQEQTAWKPTLTDLQFRLIDAARSNPKPVSWKRLIAWWEEKGWGEIRTKALGDRYRAYKKRMELS